MSSALESPNDTSSRPLFVVVMGVSGTGKTTLGRALACEINLPYVEGDGLHPASNVAKMSSGTPLTDADREPWLALVRSAAEETVLVSGACAAGPRQQQNGVIITCSALKCYYREILRGKRSPYEHPKMELETYFVFIDGPKDVLMDRMVKRPGHFMKASMLESQLQTLESPVGEDGVITVSVEDTTEEQVRKVIERLNELIGHDVRANW